MSSSAQPAWMSVGLGIVPWLALFVALASAWYSRQTYKLNRKQALEREPRLNFSLDNLWFTRTAPGGRRYELALLVTNRAATANTLVAGELVVTLALSSGHELRLRIPAIDSSDSQKLPIRLDSYASLAAKFGFDVQANMIPKDSSIKAHRFEFSDTSGEIYSVEPKLVSERRNDVS